MPEPLVRQLFAGPIDVVGDVHGELGALRRLLGRLGYARDGAHPEGRRLAFVGDLVDRGPDTPGVLALVRRLVEAGRAQCVLGNHEFNVLRGVRKPDNSWFAGAAVRQRGGRAAAADPGGAMNRTEWRACNDPRLRLDALRERAAGRKLRLFACENAWNGAKRVLWVMQQVVAEAATPADCFSRVPARVEARAQCDLSRDLFDPLFRPAPLDLSWLEADTGAVQHLARTIDEGRAFADLPVLADALEEAGCADAATCTRWKYARTTWNAATADPTAPPWPPSPTASPTPTPGLDGEDSEAVFAQPRPQPHQGEHRHRQRCQGRRHVEPGQAGQAALDGLVELLLVDLEELPQGGVELVEGPVRLPGVVAQAQGHRAGRECSRRRPPWPRAIRRPSASSPTSV
jgi:hypothetical protein